MKPSGTPTAHRCARTLFVGLILGALLAACSRSASRFAAFDPAQVAAAETRMWQAYYGSDPSALHRELSAVLSAQFGLSLEVGRTVSQQFATAAGQFASAGVGEQPEVLPALEEGYRQLKESLNLSFDPAEAARAELAWWVARKTPGQDSVAQVGGLIAELYGTIYGRPSAAFRKAGRLRAEAAQLRDAGGANCDWAGVERLLGQSYAALAKAL